jgi:cell division septation protein DedD
VPDGSLIEAPEGPYKERPDDSGGKQFAGTGDVAPAVGQGGAPDGRIADSTGAASDDQDLNLAMPPIGGADPQGSGPRAGDTDTGATGAAAGTQVAPQAAPQAASAASTGASANEGVGVQIGAFSSRARAEAGWTTLRRQSAALGGFDRRIVEGRADRGPVFRLQAVAPGLAEANALCRALKADGLDCQVKP